MTPYAHTPVLLADCVRALAPADGQVIVDCTLGGGGHSLALLQAASCRVVGLDKDPAAIAAATDRLGEYSDRFTAVHACFSQLDQVLDRLGIAHINGLLADLGVSSHQLDTAERGFSFRHNGPLDMRMDPTAALSAAQVVNQWTEAELIRILRDYGEERRAKAVARTVVSGRPWTHTGPLAAAIAGVVHGGASRIHPATRSFQAIRVAVNGELDALRDLLPQAVNRLAPGGRLAIISFHSLEDRIVKQFLARAAGRTAPRDPYGHPLTDPLVCAANKALFPPANNPNPRARSARLRTATRLSWSH